jgi:hypothetical protein
MTKRECGGRASPVREFQSRHSTWHESAANMHISRATSCGMTQLLVAPRGFARPKGLLLGNIVRCGSFLKFQIKKG